MMGAVQLIANRVVNYIVRRIFGPYLETFTHDELSIDSNKGKAVVENVALRVEALNALFKEHNLPFELLNGAIDKVSFEVPWSAFLQDSTIIEFHGVNLVVQPIKCDAEDGSMFSSVFDSMASSQQIAEEFIAYEFENETEMEQQVDSVETIVKAIDTVFSNMKIKFFNSVIRIESILEDGVTGVALQLLIQSVTCFDEGAMDSSANKNNNPDRNSAYVIKKCIVEGISIYTAQFAASEHDSNQEYSATMLSPGSPEMPPQHASLLSQKEEKVLQIEPVLISKIPGQQQLRLSLKQDEGVVGPKVDIELSLGSLNLFLSPYQVFMLIELANGFVTPGNVKNSGNTYRQPINNRPMRDADYALIEQELLKEREKRNLPSQSLQYHHGWSSHALADESDDEFQLMKVEGKTTEVPLISEDLESSCSSIGSERLTAFSSSSSEATGYKRSQKPRGSYIQAILTDPLTDFRQVHLSCSTFSIVLLHDHRSAEDSSNMDYNFSNNSLNFKSLGNIAEKYFEDLAMLSMNTLNFKDFDAIRAKISNLTKANHLRFVASGVTFESNERKSTLRKIFTTLLTVLDLEVLECLFNESDENPSKEPSHMQIVSFNNEHLPSNNAWSRKEACLKIKYSRYDCEDQLRTLKDPETASNKIEFVMTPVTVDIDISLANRIQSLLNPDLTFIRRNKKQEPFVFNLRDANSMSPHSSLKTEVQFSAPFVLLNLRFPIPDLRPYIDRLPWWKQHLRKESLVMELTDASLSFIYNPDQSDQKIELQCRDFHGLLQVSPNERISFIRVSLDPEAEKIVHDGFDWPRLVIRKVPQMNALCLDSELQEPDDDYFTSIQEAAVQSLIANMKKEPSPFTNIPVAFGSKLSSPSKEGNMSTDEIIKPAEKEKMNRFIGGIIDRSQYVFDFCLPRVNIVLPDKNFFELLYNRLSSDLLLWENTLMVPSTSHDVNNPMSSIFDFNLQPLIDHASLMSFKSCSDGDSESDDDVYTYQSVLGQSLHSLKKREVKQDSADNHKLTKLSIIMSINKGSATIHSPYKDGQGNISPDTCGRIQLCVENSKFFLASSYKGKPNESYICFLANRGHLYHDSVVPLSENFIVPQFASRPENSSNMIVYPSESDVFIVPDVAIGKGGESIDVLSIAAYAVTNAKQQTKTFKLAIGVSGSTLRHYMCPSTELWFNQFSDFVNVTDYPLHGYKPPSVVIELRLHLMNCAVDYRPLYLPFKTLVTLESFNLSTNISASTKSSLLRMISEELCLFLSNNMKTSAVDLKNDYICVLDTGLIDLSVRVTSSGDATTDATVVDDPKPKLEMSAMNSMVNIYTCSDTCQALQKLIVYLASDGDTTSAAVSPDRNLDITKVIEEEKTPPCVLQSPPVPENVHSLMVEAMKECSSAKQSSDKDQSDSEYNDSDESFCIIEDDIGVGVPPKNGEPIIRILTDQPIEILDDYFKPPSGKIDVLKASKHYPESILCQTLNEMSITWHLYGGNDFPLAKQLEKKRVRYSSCPESKDRNFNLKHGENQKVHLNTDGATASFCKITTMSRDSNVETVHCSMEQISLCHVGEDDPRSWIAKGGKGRDNSVLMEFQLNKVRIEHEEYPKDSKYVSRNVLVVHDIEIRDKLADSGFNKFLYWYSSGSMPKQTHANMLRVEAHKAYSDPRHQSEECSLIVTCQPLRLNIDQDALIFLYNFFKPFFVQASCDGQEQEKCPGPKVQSSTPTEEQSFPVIGQQRSDTSPIYIKSFSFKQNVLIRFDYKGKRVVMEQGAIQGLLMGFGQLNGSEIILKRLNYKRGLLGWERLLEYALNEWSQDIKQNQVSGLISGLGPINPLRQLFQGIKDFVWCPVAQYRKDGQIVRGLQRGASSLSTSTAAAVLELTSQFVGLIQDVAVYAYDMVSPGPSVTNRLQGNINESRRQSQPADIREGIASACTIITEGFTDTVRTVIREATIEHEHKGVPGAVGAVVRQIPSTVITPLFVSTQATKSMLHGAKHQLLPDAHKEAQDKWRTRKK